MEKSRILPLVSPEEEFVTPVEIMGLKFPNRVGLAAGLDKEGNTIDALGRLGFGFVEIGTITPRPQAGNPKPRLFRLIDHEAIINRMGFNNPGHRRRAWQTSGRRNPLAASSDSTSARTRTRRTKTRRTTTWNACARPIPVADYVAVNLSSPNTPGLRDLQGAEASARLLGTLKKEQQRLADEHGKQVPLLFKVAPDLDETHIADLSRVFLEGGLDGLIATNTTLDRDRVADHPRAIEAGGLSGRPVFEKSTAALGMFASHLGSRIPIIGVGGISSLEDAEAKIAAGASLVQIYTSFVFEGPALVRKLVRGL